ncbi:phosphoribosyl-AMP cyclohydrolase [[Clostridium] aminophilum]|uniref:Phosphoribosyl-AMP cyclohydrolase n=1 Tax=[Clostridium] aminophilum TaxID=1526 RepID=A0A1I0I5I1_9FIRM|nr:phosphoribosyl-AMP cyclohydrolase [[Clostridium] aminophilum]SET91036.1 phosphoribosyl-AMP cyclohydrolase [[Clostridium] aminophilum]
MMTEEEIYAAAERAGKPRSRTGNFEIDRIRFDEKGLVPCVVQDSRTGRVLTVAYMNRKSLEITLSRGVTCFWSRSRQELWLKGESSGHFQHIVSMEADCDADAILVRVEKDGPACHRGTDSCFDTDLHVEFAAE